MFWGRTLKQGETLNLTKEATNGALLHLSHVSLNPASKPGASTLFINHGDHKFALVTLEKDKRDFQTLDLYFTTSANTAFSLMGPAEVNLLGYFEPNEEDREMGESDEESSEEDEGVPMPVGDEEDSEEEDSEEDSDGEEPKPAAQDESSEEDSEEEVKAPAKPTPPAKPAKQPQPTKGNKPPKQDAAPQKKPKEEHKPQPQGEKAKKHGQKPTKS